MTVRRRWAPSTPAADWYAVDGPTWGEGGENINILSGNLNYTWPLLTAKARGGMSLPIGLNYNSQNWRKDVIGGSNVTWNYGRDLGYGYGFKLGAGSMQLFFNAN